MDEHAADMVINMLEEQMLQGVPGQAHPRAMQPRQLPPEQPPPMPELSSAATVLEGQRQSIESISDQAAPEPPRIPPSQPEEVAQAVSSRGVLEPPPATGHGSKQQRSGRMLHPRILWYKSGRYTFRQGNQSWSQQQHLSAQRVL